MGVPPNHPLKNRTFHQKKHPAIGDPPCMEPPTSSNVFNQKFHHFRILRSLSSPHASSNRGFAKWSK